MRYVCSNRGVFCGKGVYCAVRENGMKTLTAENIAAAIEIRRSLTNWDAADVGLERLRKYFLSNVQHSDVLVKASAIDKLYSTRVGNVYWGRERSDSGDGGSSKAAVRRRQTLWTRSRGTNSSSIQEPTGAPALLRNTATSSWTAGSSPSTTRSHSLQSRTCGPPFQPVPLGVAPLSSDLQRPDV